MFYTYLASTISYATLVLSRRLNDINYFVMTWELVDVKSDSYFVSISPTPADGLSERSTHVPSTYLSLHDNVEYNVTISLGNISYISRSFKIGTKFVIHLLSIL